MKFVPTYVDDEDNLPKKNPLRDFIEMAIWLALLALAAYFILGWVAGLMASRVSPERELAWGKGLGWHAENAGKDDESNFVQQRIAVLVKHTQLPLPPAGADKNSLPNAWVYPGGQIKMTYGLLKEAQSQNEIDFVLAHELGHFNHRHAFKSMGRGLVLVGLASVFGSDTGAGDLVSKLQELAHLQRSREAESQADRFALAVLFKEYGHVQGSTTFFERMAKKYPASLAGTFFSSHPNSENRISDLKAQAKEQGWPQSGKVVARPLFGEELKKKLEKDEEERFKAPGY